MIKRTLTIALAGITLLSINACKNKQGNSAFTKKDGYEYKIVKDAPGTQTAQIGDWITINMRMLADDSLVVDSRKMNNNKPIEFQVQSPMFKSDWTSGLSMLSAGDSAVFRISIDTMKKQLNGQPLPGFMNNAKYLTYEIGLVSIKTADEKKKDVAAEDSTTLHEYFAKNKITPQKTADGLYYTIDKEGSGPALKEGDTVSINYTGKTTDGQVFDSNTDPSKGHVKPFTFPLGAHHVIPGMDEGVMLLKKGGKATLYIPSVLAYGERQPGPGIGPNSVLIFDVEVTDVKH